MGKAQLEDENMPGENSNLVHPYQGHPLKMVRLPILPPGH